METNGVNGINENGRGDLMARSFHLSIFKGKHDATPQAVERTWKEICSRIEKPVVRADKDGPLFSPARFEPARRKKENVREVSELVLDFDHDADLDEDTSLWRETGIAFAAYTTHSSYRITESNPNAEERFRLIIPLAVPIPADKFPALWRWAAEMTGGKVDAQAKDSSRMFYTPAIAAEDAPYRFTINEGEPLDWRELDLQESEPIRTPQPAGNGSAATADAYGRAALQNETTAVLMSRSGERNDQLNKSAFALGQLVAAGVLERYEVEASLERAAIGAGMDQDKDAGGIAGVRTTIKSGMTAGARQPRQIPEKKPLRIVSPKTTTNEPADFAAYVDQATNTATETQARPPETWRQTHEGLAIELLNRHGEDIKYVSDLAKDLKPDTFVRWNGKYWEFRAKAVASISEYQREMTAVFRQHLKQILDEVEGDFDALSKQQKAAFQFGKTIESHGFKAGWKDELKGHISIQVEFGQFDADPFLLNCGNGTLDLKTKELRPHRRADLITKMVRFDYDITAECPTWIKFLNDIFENDAEMVAFIKRAVGYSLTGDTREQCLILCHGAGSNGKSTFLNILKTILGDYASSAAVKSFVQKQNESAANNDIAMLAGRRFVVAIETNEGQRLDESLVKSVTGGDTIPARFLNQEFFDLKPVFKLWFGMNHEPSIRGTDEGIWRRIRKAPFNVKFYELDDAEAPESGPFKDKELPAKLEAEATGILKWAVDGCQEWLEKGGLLAPEKVLKATAEYRADQDVLGQFIAACCLMKPFAEVETKDLYEAYATWAEENRIHPLTSRMFGRKIGERGHAIRESNGKCFRQGIGLREGVRGKVGKEWNSVD